MSRVCIIKGCEGDLCVYRRVSLHAFPTKNTEVCKKWVEFVRTYSRPSYSLKIVLKSHRICSQHFKKSDFLREDETSVQLAGFRKRHLKKYAVPSIINSRSLITSRSHIDGVQQPTSMAFHGTLEMKSVENQNIGTDVVSTITNIATQTPICLKLLSESIGASLPIDELAQELKRTKRSTQLLNAAESSVSSVTAASLNEGHYPDAVKGPVEECSTTSFLEVKIKEELFEDTNCDATNYDQTSTISNVVSPMDETLMNLARSNWSVQIGPECVLSLIENGIVVKSMSLAKSGIYDIKVLNHSLTDDHPALAELPDCVCNPEDLISITSTLENGWSICSAIPESLLFSNFNVSIGGTLSYHNSLSQTVRSNNCELLVKDVGGRCEICQELYDVLVKGKEKTYRIRKVML